MTDYNSAFELDYLCVDAPDGKITADRLMRTAGVSPAHLTECVRLAALWPPLPNQRTEAMPGSVGLFRGESVDYILVKAQQGSNGAPRFQYVLTPAAPLRQLAGNWRWFEPFARAPIPESTGPRADLPLLSFSEPQPASIETQVDDLLALLSFCKNRVPLVRGLVAALVQMMAIGIVNAPLSLTDRLTFVQGLLTLLPAPLRGGITFASSVIDPARTNAQIKFLASDMRPARHLIFDWAAGKLLTDPPDDVYSQFIIAQFRLDPALAVEQTQALERTAAWRMARKDDLANALAWAARRASLDSALKNGQPGDPKMVAEVLAEDPSLTSDLRVLYARHLLALSLSLDEPERTDAIGAAAARYAYVANAVADELQPFSVEPTHAPIVERILTRWLGGNANFDLGDPRWVSLLSGAILTRAKPIIEGDDPVAIRELLESYITLPPTLRLERAMAQLIGSCRKAAYTDPATARAVFLLAAAFLPASGLQRLLADNALIAQLPDALSAVFPILNPASTAPDAPPPSAPSGLLARASEVFGPEHRPVILSRLVEWALNLRRLDLIDPEALRGLVEAGGLTQGARFDVLTNQIVEDLSRINTIRTLDLRSIQYLVALSLVRERYATAIAQLEFYQNTLYKGSNSDELLQLVQRIFQETPLTIAQLTNTVEAMQPSDLRSVVRAHAYLGAILGRNWAPEIGFAIQALSALLAADASLIPVIGVPTTLRVIQGNVERRDAVGTLKLAAALSENALIMGDQGGALIERLYTLINWGPEMTASALETLRNYVRRAPLPQAKALADRMGQQYGPAMSKTLDAVYRLRLILGNGTFATLADQVTTGVGLLMDMAATYDESQETPPLHKLYNTVKALSGNLTEAERERLASNLYRLADQLIQVARLRAHNTPKQNVSALLVHGTIAPASGVDALRWIGGQFANHRVITPNLNRAEPPYLFGSRSVNTLLRDTDTLVQLLNTLLAAFPEGAPPLDNAALHTEAGSVWALLPLEVQRQIVGKLAENAQLLAELIGIIGDKGNERSLASTGYGRQLVSGRVQPRSVIDVLRWVNGYFMGQHVG
ncbi:MAG: hypothetical protein ACYDBJ_12660 [Aggregatilineales bacterium]